MIDDAAGIEDGGIFDSNMCTNIYAGGNYDVFTDLSGAGHAGSGVDGADEVDAGLSQEGSIFLSDTVIANGYEGSADACFRQSLNYGKIAEYLDTVYGLLMQSWVGIDKAGYLKLMIIAEDIQYDSTVTAGTDYNYFHPKRPCIKKLTQLTFRGPITISLYTILGKAGGKALITVNYCTKRLFCRRF